jgi:Protein of unknown function (DUF2946)
MNEHPQTWPAFDDEVVRAMAKWPDVPQCFGWLSLDVRGRWRLKNELIQHTRAQAFLSRHYRADERGRWYVQNGPQQVFVALDYTPWIYRWQPQQLFTTHTGLNTHDVRSAYLDDDGNLLLLTALGVGMLDDRDLAACENLIEWDDAGSARAFLWRQQRLPLASLGRAHVATHFGFVAHPQ